MLRDSFLGRTSLLKSQNQSDITIKIQSPMTIGQILKDSYPNILADIMIKKAKKDLEIVIFIFDLKYDGLEWSLKKRLSEFVHFEEIVRKKYHSAVPLLPIHKEYQLNDYNVRKFADFLHVYLKKVVAVGLNDSDVRDFLNIMPQKFGHGIILTEVDLRKHSGGRYTEATCMKKIQKNFCCCCRNWRTRYFTVTDEGIYYTVKKKSHQLKEMLPFSMSFQILCGQNQTNHMFGITINSAYRILELKADTLYQFSIFISCVKQALDKTPNQKNHRFQSFSDVRRHCETKFYIDGQGYFSDLNDALMEAKHYVYITDWMFTPYILLKRPRQLDDRTTRLDYVLEEIANKGVKIYIIVFMQPKIALNNDSEFVQKYMGQLSKNIKVLRHPNYILVPFLWSHHQKIVIIDQKTAFLGGLDLCYGRWDNQKHYITNKDQLWKGADYCNFRTSDIYKPRNFLRSNIDCASQPRMPWHDIGIQICGQSIHDLARHFIQYWNFVSFQTRFNERELLLQAGHRTNISKKQSNLDETNRKTNQQQLQKIDHITEDQFYKHYLNTANKNPFNQIDLPSLHDIKSYPRKIIELIKDGEVSSPDQQRLIITHASQIDQFGKHTHQILRSSSTWSLGLQANNHQCSIYNAYLDLIQNAEHYIYIENQFFISDQNRICQFIANRILKAHKKQEKFKVIILMPLLPGFQGQILSEGASVLKIQLHWQYATISRSKNSIYDRLSSINNIDDYLAFYSLRSHGVTNFNIPVTEILYIHSKLIIVDDRKVLLGSANINDRSLLGDRDSQIGIIIEDQDHFTDSNGHLISKQIHRLRMELYKEHFGLTQSQSQNFHNQSVWSIIRARAHRSTEIYREVFGCYPDNLMQQYSDVNLIKNKADITKYHDLSPEIVGHVVELPINFLMKQNLRLKPNQKQFYVPEISYT